MLCHVPFWIKCDKKQCYSKTEHIRVENVLAFNNVAANLLTFVTHLLTSHDDKVLELFFVQYSFSRGSFSHSNIIRTAWDPNKGKLSYSNADIICEDNLFWLSGITFVAANPSRMTHFLNGPCAYFKKYSQVALNLNG